MILSSEMREAGQKAVDRAREDGCASIYILCAAFFEAAIANHSEEPLGAEPVVERQCSEVDSQCSELLRIQAAPPELAELQATIARLTAQNERLKGGQGEAVFYIGEPLRNSASSTPAPVAVVLPELQDENNDSQGNDPLCWYPQGWNACLDKVKELNQ